VHYERGHNILALSLNLTEEIQVSATLYPGGTRFEFMIGHCLSWQKGPLRFSLVIRDECSDSLSLYLMTLYQLHMLTSNWWMILNDELGRMWKEAAGTYFKLNFYDTAQFVRRDWIKPRRRTSVRIAENGSRNSRILNRSVNSCTASSVLGIASWNRPRQVSTK
jgi:hypothetical protein